MAKSSKYEKISQAMSQTLQEVFEATEEEVKIQVQKALLDGLEGFSDIGHYKLHLQWKRRKLAQQLQQEVARATQVTQQIAAGGAEALGVETKAYVSHSEKAGRLLIKSALGNFTEQHMQISRLKWADSFHDDVLAQMDTNFEHALPITLPSGRTWGYKEYMEMKVRTTLQQEMTKTLIENSRNAGIIFYICNSFGDCADDHKHWQGRIYVNNKWFVDTNLPEEIKVKIRNFIKSYDIVSIQSVTTWDPKRDKFDMFNPNVGIGTRPNCRHKLTPISIDQALNMNPKEILHALKLDHGTYKQQNAIDREQQRYNERQIRMFKTRVRTNQELLAMKTSPAWQEKLNKRIKRDQAAVKAWQLRQRKLIESNPNLDRDYDREDSHKIINHLGAKFEHLKKKAISSSVPPSGGSTPPTTVSAATAVPPSASQVDQETDALIDRLTILEQHKISEAYISYNKLAAETGKIWKQWTPEQKSAAYEYTASGFREMNQGLRTGVWSSDIVRAQAEALRQAIDKSPLPEPITVGRTGSAADAAHIFGLKIGDVRDLLSYGGKSLAGPEATTILQATMDQVEVKLPAFTSTTASMDKKFDPSANVHMEIHLPKGTKAIYATPFARFGGGTFLHDSGEGAYENWTGNAKELQGNTHMSENEIIVQAGTRYRILGAEFVEVSGFRNLLIKMEAILDE